MIELLLGHVGNLEEHSRYQVDALEQLSVDMRVVRLHAATLSPLLVLGSLARDREALGEELTAAVA